MLEYSKLNPICNLIITVEPVYVLIMIGIISQRKIIIKSQL